MHYLFLGTDTALKDKQLAKIKETIFKNTDALRLDFETIDGHKLTPEKLKIALLGLPALAAQRLVYIRQAEKLSKENLELLASFLQEKNDHVVLVFDAENWDGRSETRKQILLSVKTVGSAPAEGANVFTMMDALAARDLVGMLKILKELFDNDEPPERLLGGIVWAWSNKLKSRLSSENYKKGLLVLQEADNHLKRSRFPERGYALEVAMVKLASLLKA